MDVREVAAALYPALASGDRDVLDALLAPDFVGDTTPGLPLNLGGRYPSATAMRREFWGGIARTFDVVAEPAEFVALPGARVLVIGRYSGLARDTGRTLDAWFQHILTVADGRITALTQLTDSAAWAAALEPAGHPALTYAPGALAHLTLNRPGVANAIDVATTRELRDAATRIAADPTVRVVLLDATGERFCAGGDVGLFAATPHSELPAVLDAMISDYHVALGTLADLDVPVVCAVQGAAAGGGLGLLYAADVVLAADDAKFTLGYAALGLTGDGGNSWYLPRIVGPRLAAQLFLQNRVLTADEALRHGLVSELVAPHALAARAEQVATELAAGPTRALGAMRRLLREAPHRSLTEQFDAERRTITAAAATADAAEGVAAFASKRRPTFTGSPGSRESR